MAAPRVNAFMLFAGDATTGAMRARVSVPKAMRDWEDACAGRGPADDGLYLAG